MKNDNISEPRQTKKPLAKRISELPSKNPVVAAAILLGTLVTAFASIGSALGWLHPFVDPSSRFQESYKKLHSVDVGMTIAFLREEFGEPQELELFGGEHAGRELSRAVFRKDGFVMVAILGSSQSVVAYGIVACRDPSFQLTVGEGPVKVTLNETTLAKAGGPSAVWYSWFGGNDGVGEFLAEESGGYHAVQWHMYGWGHYECPGATGPPDYAALKELSRDVTNDKAQLEPSFELRTEDTEDLDLQRYPFSRLREETVVNGVFKVQAGQPREVYELIVEELDRQI